ncbi:MAG TPA: hypothetical protein VGA37_06135 [Gemmatimonadales bacterium]
MARREWFVLGGILAVVVVAVALEPDHSAMPEHADGGAMHMEATPAARTVTLAVSGMT